YLLVAPRPRGTGAARRAGRPRRESPARHGRSGSQPRARAHRARPRTARAPGPWPRTQASAARAGSSLRLPIDPVRDHADVDTREVAHERRDERAAQDLTPPALVRRPDKHIGGAALAHDALDGLD